MKWNPPPFVCDVFRGSFARLQHQCQPPSSTKRLPTHHFDCDKCNRRCIRRFPSHPYLTLYCSQQNQPCMMQMGLQTASLLCIPHITCRVLVRKIRDSKVVFIPMHSIHLLFGHVPLSCCFSFSSPDCVCFIFNLILVIFKVSERSGNGNVRFEKVLKVSV